MPGNRLNDSIALIKAPAAVGTLRCLRRAGID